MAAAETFWKYSCCDSAFCTMPASRTSPSFCES